MPALDDRSLGWLRYLHRKATTPDNWDRDGRPHPDRYRPIVPAGWWGEYDVSGWTANGIEPYGMQPDPVAADGMLFYKGFFNLLMSLHRYVSGSTKWDQPFEMIRDEANTFEWTHSGADLYYDPVADEHVGTGWSMQTPGRETVPLTGENNRVNVQLTTDNRTVIVRRSVG